MGTLMIVPEELFRGNGYSPAVALDDLKGKSIQLTLSITRMMEEQTLEVLDVYKRQVAGIAAGSEYSAGVGIGGRQGVPSRPEAAEQACVSGV